MKSTAALLLRVLVLATTTTTCRGDEGKHDKPEVTKITAQLEKPVSDFTATYFDGPIEGSSAPKDQQSERSIVLIGGCSDPLGNVYNEIFKFFSCSQFTSEVNVFYPDTETFGKLPDLPEPRSRHTAIAEGRKIYVIGGRSETDALIKNVIVFDPETQEWTDFITLDDDHAVSDHGTVLYRGKIYVFGGWDEFYQGPRATTFSIDPMDNGKIEDLTDMFTPRGDVAAVHFNHGGVNEAYIIGGFGKEFCKPLSSIERYDFDEDSWTETSTEKLELVQGRGDKIATVLDKKIYVIGGEDTHEDACDSPDALQPSEKSQAIDNVEVLDPLAKSPSWELHSLIPNSEERFRAAYALDLRANNFYIFGGQKEYNNDCDCYRTANDIYVFHGKHPGKGLGTTATALIVTASIVFVVAVVAIIYKKN